MTVVAKGEDELMALVSETARPVISEALQDHRHVAEESLAHAEAPEERERLEHQLALMGSMLHQIDGTTGQVHLTGPEEMVARVVKTATSNAAHDLDTLVEEVASTSTRLDVEAREELRARAAVTATCVETLIACEGSRRR